MTDTVQDNTPTDAPMQTRHLDPATVVLEHDAFGKLSATVQGQPYTGVRAVRAFPLTARHHWVFLLDDHDKEIGVIDDARQLPAASRQTLEAELDLAYFATRITRILDVKSRHGVTTWDVDTERGEKTVHIKERGDIRHLAGGHLVFTDIDGMKYEIRAVADMDPRSRDFIDAES